MTLLGISRGLTVKNRYAPYSDYNERDSQNKKLSFWLAFISWYMHQDFNCLNNTNFPKPSLTIICKFLCPFFYFYAHPIPQSQPVLNWPTNTLFFPYLSFICSLSLSLSHAYSPSKYCFYFLLSLFFYHLGFSFTKCKTHKDRKGGKG